jgi:hypothetical protein
MSNNFNIAKARLAHELEKNGSSIFELEEYLADLEKQGEEGAWGQLGTRVLDGLTKGVGWIGSHLPEATMTAALVGGPMIGGAAYAANRSLDNEDKELAERKALIDRYKQLTSRVKADYGLK